MAIYPLIYDMKPLFRAAGIESVPRPGIARLYERMEIPESNPWDEWITLGLHALQTLHERGFRPKTVAEVGTGNGILALGAATVFSPERIFLTDIVEEVLFPSAENLAGNMGGDRLDPCGIRTYRGRDAQPLPMGAVDLVMFSPPPLMIDDEKKLDQGLSRTTLTDRAYYQQFSKGPQDPLLRWSILPWHSFLLSARPKLTPSGIVLGLYSGRVPLYLIQEAHERAGFSLSVLGTIIKRQQDPVFLEEYAAHEEKYISPSSFDFYLYEEARCILQKQGFTMPGLINLPEQEIKAILQSAKISAKAAFAISQQGLPVAHLGHALIGAPL